MSRTNRTQPHHSDAEASVLGGVLLRNEVLAQLDALEVDDFYELKHKVVWQAMRNLEAATKPIDIVTLEAEIEKLGKLDAIGGVAFLGQLANNVPTVENVEAYTELVLAASQARQTIAAASEILDDGFAEGLDVEEYIAGAVAKLARIDRGKTKSVVTVGAMVKRRVEEYEDIARRRAAGEEVVLGVPTGIASLDELVGGYPVGDLVVIACRPGMGKTAMLMASADACSAYGLGVHVFSMEGGWRMYADRIAARWSGIAVARLRKGDITAADMFGIGNALMKAHTRSDRYLIDPVSGLTAVEIVRRVRRDAKKNNTRVAYVDYLNIAKRPRGLESDENAAHDSTITTFAQAAVNDGITYVVACQLNRKVEDRTDKRPQLADIRGAGALEERPRLVVSPYRGAYYYDEPKDGIDFACDCHPDALRRGAPCPHRPSDEDFKKLVQVLVLKNNNGAAPVTCKATWRGDTTEMY